MLDETWIDDWHGDLEGRLAHARALAAGLQELSGAGLAGGGLVGALVDSSGALVDLHLDEEVRRHSGQWIAEQVLTAVQAARRELAERAAMLAAEAGADRTLVEAFTARLGEGA